ncbi:putative HTH-type transcriptional regulator YfiR [compost metagenome]
MSVKKNKPSNREIVLREASHLFLTKGFQVTSMDDIVAQSKVSKTNIYYYFKSKEELLLVIVDGLVSHYEQRLNAIFLQDHVSVLGKLERLPAILTENDEQANYLGGCPFLTLYTQTSNESIEVRNRIQAFFQRQFVAVEQLLAAGIANKEINPALPVEQTAALIISSIEGSLFIAKAANKPTLLKELFPALALLLK